VVTKYCLKRVKKFLLQKRDWFKTQNPDIPRINSFQALFVITCLNTAHGPPPANPGAGHELA
jgi:hypothetical protein